MGRFGVKGVIGGNIASGPALACLGGGYLKPAVFIKLSLFLILDFLQIIMV